MVQVPCENKANRGGGENKVFRIRKLEKILSKEGGGDSLIYLESYYCFHVKFDCMKFLMPPSTSGRVKEGYEYEACLEFWYISPFAL